MTGQVTRDSLIADLLATWLINDQVNQYLIEHLAEDAWTAKSPGGKGRNIAGIFAHMHNVRLMWLKAAEKGTAIPAKLEPAEATRSQTLAALAESSAAIAKLLEAGLATGRVSGFPPSAAAFLGYLLAHDAHHRGQITMLARQVGHALPAAAGFALWEWNARGSDRSS